MSIISVGTPRCQGDISYSKSWEERDVHRFFNHKECRSRRVDRADGTSYHSRTEYREICPIPEAWFGLVQLLILHCSAT